MLFQLQILFNTHDYPQYPYVAVSDETSRILVLSDEYIGLLEKEDSVYFETDYLPTSRAIELDLPGLDKMINDYTGQQEYAMITRFGPEKHITLTYHSPTNEGPKHYDIFINYPDARARKLVEEVYALMNELRIAANC